jgi:hypothetical protein
MQQIAVATAVDPAIHAREANMSPVSILDGIEAVRQEIARKRPHRRNISKAELWACLHDLFIQQRQLRELYLSVKRTRC